VVSGAFRSVLRCPGTRRPAAGALLASVPIGMLGLAVLLLVQRSRGGFGAAGLAVGLLGAGTAAGMVVQGRLIDRYGQTPVLLAAAGAQSAGMIGLVAAGRSGAGGALLVCAFLTGACEPQVNASLRALWPTLVPLHLLPAAMTLSSVLFEMPVLLGPLLVAVLLLIAGPPVVIGVCAVLFAGGTVLLATSRPARARRGEKRRRDLTGALAGRGMRALLVVAAGHGAIVGVVQVSAAARFTAYAGLMYAALAAGSLSGAVVGGTRMQDGRPARRMAALTAGCAVALGAAFLAPAPLTFAGSLFLLGGALGPAGVLGFALAGRHAPPGHTVEAFTMITASGLTAVAGGAALAGAAADHLGPTAALPIAGAGALLLAVFVAARLPAGPGR